MRAVTIGDVIQRIEDGAPTGTDIAVTSSATPCG